MNLLQALAKKAESAAEHLADDVRAIIIKAHEDLDALFEHDKAVADKVEPEVTGTLTPAAVESPNAAPAAEPVVTVTTPVPAVEVAVSAPETVAPETIPNVQSHAESVDAVAVSGTATDAPAVPTETPAAE